MWRVAERVVGTRQRGCSRVIGVGRIPQRYAAGRQEQAKDYHNSKTGTFIYHSLVYHGFIRNF